MLGEAVSMLVPQVVGFRLTGGCRTAPRPPTSCSRSRRSSASSGVVGKFVEYFGAGLVGLPVADRATLGNMSPEYGATCGFFPVDDETLAYLRLTGREEEHVALVEAYCKENLLWHDPADGEPTYYADRRARSRHGRAEPRRPPAAAGPRAATRREGVVPRCPPSFGVDYGTAEDAASAESFPAATRSPCHARPRGVAGDRHRAVPDVGERSQAVWCELDGERFPSITARSSSRPSRAARTPRTHR